MQQPPAVALMLWKPPESKPCSPCHLVSPVPLPQACDSQGHLQKDLCAPAGKSGIMWGTKMLSDSTILAENYQRGTSPVGEDVRFPSPRSSRPIGWRYDISLASVFVLLFLYTCSAQRNSFKVSHTLAAVTVTSVQSVAN